MAWRPKGPSTFDDDRLRLIRSLDPSLIWSAIKTPFSSEGPPDRGDPQRGCGRLPDPRRPRQQVPPIPDHRSLVSGRPGLISISSRRANICGRNHVLTLPTFSNFIHGFTLRMSPFSRFFLWGGGAVPSFRSGPRGQYVRYHPFPWCSCLCVDPCLHSTKQYSISAESSFFEASDTRQRSVLLLFFRNELTGRFSLFISTLILNHHGQR